MSETNVLPREKPLPPPSLDRLIQDQAERIIKRINTARSPGSRISLAGIQTSDFDNGYLVRLNTYDPQRMESLWEAEHHGKKAVYVTWPV